MLYFLLMNKHLAVITLFTLIAVPSLYPQEIPDPDIGTVSIGGRLQLDYFSHRLGQGWNTVKSGYKNINNVFTYNELATSAPGWENSAGQTLFLDVGYRPTGNFRADIGFEVINEYADRYWMPINIEHRMKLDEKKFLWTRGDMEFLDDKWNAKYFRGKHSYDWDYTADMFNVLPEQYEVEKYMRISGRVVPEGYQLQAKGGMGDLTLLYGPEVIWGLRHGVYGNYSFNAFGVRSSIIFADQIISYGDPDERVKAFEYSAAFNILNVPVQTGLLYRPFRMNKEYLYAEKVEQGTGLMGSSFLKKSGTTASNDAFGYSTKIMLRPEPLFKEAILRYTYEGLVSGNKTEYALQCNRTISRSFYGTIETAYRKPLMGNIPLVLEGTPANPGPALFEPRGADSPFRVDFDNREASLFSFTLTYDPTPVSWFYRYSPNIPEEWNLNPRENAPYAFALRYDMTKYYTATDHLYYYNENGEVVWESSLLPGAWATDGYIGAVRFIGRYLFGKWAVLLNIGTGDSLATSGLAYTTEEDKEKPVTNFLDCGVSLSNGIYSAKLRYGKDIWGPEEWHRSFGETFDNLYQLQVSRSIGGYITTGAHYTRTQESDKKYFAPELGDYEEINYFVSLSFGSRAYFNAKPEADTKGIKP